MSAINIHQTEETQTEEIKQDNNFIPFYLNQYKDYILFDPNKGNCVLSFSYVKTDYINGETVETKVSTNIIHEMIKHGFNYKFDNINNILKSLNLSETNLLRMIHNYITPDNIDGDNYIKMIINLLTDENISAETKVKLIKYIINISPSQNIIYKYALRYEEQNKGLYIDDFVFIEILKYFIKKTNKDILKTLLLKSKINDHYNKWRCDYLIEEALMTNNFDIIKLIIENKYFNIYAYNIYPLHVAVKCCDKNIIEYLLSYKLDINRNMETYQIIGDEKKLIMTGSPVQYALYYRRYDLIEILNPYENTNML